MSKLEHISPVLAQCASRDGLIRNPFRIFGMRVDTAPKQVDSAIKELRMHMELGMTCSHAFAPTTFEQGMLVQAGQRLRDAVTRICDECFWFWPMDIGAEDVALEHISSGNKKAAAEEWSAFLEHPEWGPIARHNLAILSLYESLDNPAAIADFGDNASRFLASEACANRIKARMRTLDDPRLPRTSCDVFMQEWKRAVVGSQVRAALSKIEQREPADAARHIRCAQRVAGEDAIIAETAEREFEPSLRQLESRCQSTKVENATDSDWQSLAVDAQRLVERMRNFPGLAERAAIAGNEAAGFLMRLALHSHNNLKNSRRSLNILEATRGMASGDTLEKVRRDIATITKIIESAEAAAAFEPLNEKIKMVKAQGHYVSSQTVRNLLAEINAIASASPSEGSREILDVLYHNLGFAVRGLAVDSYNATGSEENAARLLDLADAVVEASARHGNAQLELKYKLNEDRAALARNRRASGMTTYSTTGNRPAYSGSSGGNSCLLALVALLCLTGAVGYAAPVAAKAVTAWITHQLQ